MTLNASTTGSATAVHSFCTSEPQSAADRAVSVAHQRIFVERCVAELRAGRPVRIRQGAKTSLIHTAEGVLSTSDQLQGLRQISQNIRLALPLERLEHLGASSGGAASYSLTALSDDQVHDLVFAKSVSNHPDLQPVTPIEAAALDLAKFAQLLPAVFVTELDDSESFNWTLEVTIQSVRDFHHETAVSLSLITRTPVPLLDDADAEFVVFRGSDGLKDQIAIVVGQPDPQATVPVRLHSACLTGDLFGSLKCDCGEQLRRAVRAFAETGGGVLLYLDQEGRGIGLSNKMRAYALQAEGYDTVDADGVLGYGTDERRYEIAAQMVDLLGYKQVSLLTNNPRKIAALEAHGIRVADRIALVGTVNRHNERYLKAKVERAGHLSECSNNTDA